MTRTILAAFLVTTFAAGSALAANRCAAPQAEWQPKESLQKKLEAEGWKIRQIKVDDGCYEVYGTDAKGKKMETYFDPKTFIVVASK